MTKLLLFLASRPGHLWLPVYLLSRSGTPARATSLTRASYGGPESFSVFTSGKQNIRYRNTEVTCVSTYE